MDTYYTLANKESYKKGVYIGSDPNLRYQKCLILNEDKDMLNVRIFDSYMGDFHTCLNKKDIYII